MKRRTLQAAPARGGAELRRVVEAALPIANERAKLVGDMRAALEAKDDQLALRLLRRFVGLPTVQAEP